jgi:hypothetical protein
MRWSSRRVVANAGQEGSYAHLLLTSKGSFSVLTRKDPSWPRNSNSIRSTLHRDGPVRSIQYHRGRIIKGQGSFCNDTMAATFLAYGFPHQGISQGVSVLILDSEQCHDFIPTSIALEQSQLDGLTRFKTARQCFDFMTFVRWGYRAARRSTGLSRRFHCALHRRTHGGGDRTDITTRLTTRALNTIAINSHGEPGNRSAHVGRDIFGQVIPFQGQFLQSGLEHPDTADPWWLDASFLCEPRRILLLLGIQ